MRNLSDLVVGHLEDLAYTWVKIFIREVVPKAQLLIMRYCQVLLISYVLASKYGALISEIILPI